jgi:hypothetical protein
MSVPTWCLSLSPERSAIGPQTHHNGERFVNRRGCIIQRESHDQSARSGPLSRGRAGAARRAFENEVLGPEVMIPKRHRNCLQQGPSTQAIGAARPSLRSHRGTRSRRRRETVSCSVAHFRYVGPRSSRLFALVAVHAALLEKPGDEALQERAAKILGEHRDEWLGDLACANRPRCANGHREGEDRLSADRGGPRRQPARGAPRAHAERDAVPDRLDGGSRPLPALRHDPQPPFAHPQAGHDGARDDQAPEIHPFAVTGER